MSDPAYGEGRSKRLRVPSAPGASAAAAAAPGEAARLVVLADVARASSAAALVAALGPRSPFFLIPPPLFDVRAEPQACLAAATLTPCSQFTPWVDSHGFVWRGVGRQVDVSAEPAHKPSETS